MVDKFPNHDNTRATFNTERPLDRVDQYITPNSKYMRIPHPTPPNPSMYVSTPIRKYPHSLTKVTINAESPLGPPISVYNTK